MALGLALLLARSGAPPPEPLGTPERGAAPPEMAAAPAPERAAPEPTLAAPTPAGPPAAATGPAAEPDERRAAIRARLETSIAEHLPDLKLSSDQLDAATDALLRLRSARLELAALPRTPENAERLRELTEAIGQAALDFEYVVDLDPAEFSARVSEGEE